MSDKTLQKIGALCESCRGKINSEIVDLMIEVALETLGETLEARRATANKTWEPNYCPKCGDTVLICPDCATADAPEEPWKELRKAATLYISALKSLAGGYRAQESWQRIDAYNDSVNIQEERWHNVLNRLDAQQEEG